MTSIPVLIRINGIRQFVSVAARNGDGKTGSVSVTSSPRSAAGPVLIRGAQPQAWSPFGSFVLRFRASLEALQKASGGFSKRFQNLLGAGVAHGGQRKPKSVENVRNVIGEIRNVVR